MHDLFFYIFAFLTLACGFLVVYNPFSRNTVTHAMFLVLSMISLAGLFAMLNAFFLAAVQVIVYAGAVIVVFLFILMLLNLDEEKRRRIKVVSGGFSVITAFLLACIMIDAIKKSDTTGAGTAVIEGGTAALGMKLFTEYLLPFEIVSVLLLVAMVGVILLSKKDLK